MASWTSPTIHATGDVFSVQDNNALANDLTFLYQAPYAYAYATSTGNFPTGAVTQVPLNTMPVSGYGFTLAANYLAVPLTGTYYASGGLFFNTEASGYMYVQLDPSGSPTTTGAISPMNTSPGALSTVGAVQSCNALSTMGLAGVQTSGNLAQCGVGYNLTYLSAFFIGSQ